MAKPTRRKPIRRISGPINPSRAAGPPAPASAAATAPRPGPFFNPDREERVSSFGDLGSAAVGDTAQRITAESQSDASLAFTRHVREDAVSDGTVSVDASLATGLTEGKEANETLDEAIARIRGVRSPLGAYAQKLALPERAGYKRHWFNDQADRVTQAELNGWAFVRDRERKPIRRAVGSGRDGGVQYAYAMEIPTVFWLEDMAARHAEAQSRIDALKASPFKSPQGMAKASDRGKFYDPQEETGAGPVQVVKAG